MAFFKTVLNPMTCTRRRKNNPYVSLWADLDLQKVRLDMRGCEIKGVGWAGTELVGRVASLSRSIHPSRRSYSDGGQPGDSGLSGLGLRWRSGRVIAPQPSTRSFLPGTLTRWTVPFFFFPLPNPLPSSTHRLREAFKLSRLLQLRGCISVRSVSCGVFFLVTHVYLGCPALKDASINRTYNGSKWMKKKSHSLSSRRLSFCGKPAFRIRANSVGYPELECSPQGWACPNKWQGI